VSCHFVSTRTTKLLQRHHRVAAYRFFSSRSADGWKVAIVGSGPSGCYTAKYLNSVFENSQIDVLERLATPYGLVRSGVAPDHPEVKNVERDFDKLFEDNNSNDGSNIQFYGNVNVGKDISLDDLRQLYDIVVLAYGCETNKPFHFLSNSHLEGILSAREFVAWYNGHVDYEWVGPLVEQALQRGDGNSQNAVVIGHGNVALDCARILSKTRQELDETDIATRALDVLKHDATSDQTRKISVVGRRGHIQGAFTIKELRELTKLPHADFVVQTEELDMGRNTASQQELNDTRPRKRIDKLLTDAAMSSSEKRTNKNTQVDLRFLLNPVGFESDDGTSLSNIVCERTRLTGEVGHQTAEGTGELHTIKAQLVCMDHGFSACRQNETGC
jgi:adrenodoxin-NADP+ reductase